MRTFDTSTRKGDPRAKKRFSFEWSSFHCCSHRNTSTSRHVLNHNDEHQFFFLGMRHGQKLKVPVQVTLNVNESIKNEGVCTSSFPHASLPKLFVDTQSVQAKR